MSLFPESLLWHIWKNKLFAATDLYTTDGRKVTILELGYIHQEVGPDVFNAKIEIDGLTWAGNIEIDIKSSSWIAHKHVTNPAYASIILHVVYELDSAIVPHSFPILELKNYIPAYLISNYKTLLETSYDFIPCEKNSKSVDDIYWNSWADRLVIQRLEYKTQDILVYLKSVQNNWKVVIYHTLAKYFGFKTNAMPFELVAKSLPINCIESHQSSLLQIEALLFGQAGWLEKDFIEEYALQLKQEYTFLQKKFHLTPIELGSWKFGKLRPANFPTIRMAQLASFLQQHSANLFSKIIDATCVEDYFVLLNCTPSTYWDTHYVLDKESKGSNKKMGKDAIHGIIINVFIPILFAYSIHIQEEDYKEKALLFLDKIVPEKNSIMNKWKEIGKAPSSALVSQAFLELYTNYCTANKCLECSIGTKIIGNK